MPHPTDVHVGQKVREARVTKGYSQEDLGNKLGISFQQVQKYEKGTNRIGSSRLWEISQALNSPITYFFDGIEDNKDQSPSNIPRRTIELAGRIDAIHDENIRNQILNLIKACSRKSN